MNRNQKKQMTKAAYKYWLDESGGYDKEEIMVDSFVEGYKQAFAINGVSKSVAKEYVEFCVRCDREGLPLLELDDYIEQYCC